MHGQYGPEGINDEEKLLNARILEEISLILGQERNFLNCEARDPTYDMHSLGEVTDDWHAQDEELPKQMPYVDESGT